MERKMPSWEKVARDLENLLLEVRKIISFMEETSDAERVVLIDKLLEREAY